MTSSFVRRLYLHGEGIEARHLEAEKFLDLQGQSARVDRWHVKGINMNMLNVSERVDVQ